MESNLNKHKIRLRNIFLIEINGLYGQNQECGRGVEEVWKKQQKFAWFISKFRRFLPSKNT